MENLKIGIMQGRLTEMGTHKSIQFFPFENWRKEFDDAKEIELNEIEFIFDYERYNENPLWLENGEQIAEAVKTTGVKVNSVCFDYFMRRPFYKYNGIKRDEIRKENIEIIIRILENMDKNGISLIEIPLVDDSSLKSQKEEELFRQFLLEVVLTAPKSIYFSLETDFEPHKFKAYLDSFGTSRIGANYDSGNSSGIGYEPYEELTTLRDYIFNIHIKDRVYHGTTVALGTGSADFEAFFRGIREINYQGSFILQAARGDDGLEKENIKNQMRFIQDHLVR